MSTKKLIAIIIGMALVVSGAYFCIWCFSAPTQNFRYIAHRGYSDKYYENTAAAFEGAAEADFWGVETDIRLTSDGVIICHHDDTALFADGTSLTISESTFADLTAQPLSGDGATAESYIPTFSEYLSICKSINRVAVIEMKDLSFSDEAVSLMLSEIDANYDRSLCNIISFYEENLLKVRAADSDIKIFLLADFFNNDIKNLCFENNFNLSLNKKGLSNRACRLMHRQGLEVGVWTIKENVFLARAKWNEVDYITCNSYFI